MSKVSKKKKKPGKKKKITPRIRKFIDFFIETDNATQSYIDAKYSENGAGQSARNLLKNPYIQEEIARRRLEICRENDSLYKKFWNMNENQLSQSKST